MRRAVFGNLGTDLRSRPCRAALRRFPAVGTSDPEPRADHRGCDRALPFELGRGSRTIEPPELPGAARPGARVRRWLCSRRYGQRIEPVPVLGSRCVVVEVIQRPELGARPAGIVRSMTAP